LTIVSATQTVAVWLATRIPNDIWPRKNQYFGSSKYPTASEAGYGLRKRNYLTAKKICTMEVIGLCNTDTTQIFTVFMQQVIKISH
jgi:hypothetical protein